MSSQHEPTKRRLTSHPDPSVSIVIPAKNAGEEFALTLEVIRSQADIEAEIIVVDSGSTDATVELARRFGANVFEVAAESFDHGRTRNLGLSQASGEFCVLLSQDAVPVGETWLSTLLEPFSDDQVVGISACMVPREDADPMGRWETESHRELMGNFVQKYRLQSGDCFSSLIREERLRVTCFNNVCSALRRDVWEKIPFRPGSFAEDMDWAVRALAAGHRIVYNPRARAVHSHNRPPSYHLRRHYISNRIVPQVIHWDPPSPAIRDDLELAYLIRSLRAEVAFLLKEQAASFQRIEELRPSIAAGTRGQSLLSALGHGVPDYPEHEIRQSFYFQLARISRSNISIEAGQMKDLLEKLLARIIGEALGAYYFWCERNRCVSENFKRLDRSLCGEGRAGSRQREEIDRLLVAHAGGETKLAPKMRKSGRLEQTAQRWARRFRTHVRNSGVGSIESWAEHPLQTALMLIPLGAKRRINRLARKPLFDLSVYEPFAARGVFRQDIVLEIAHFDDDDSGDKPRLVVHTPHPGVGNLGLMAQLVGPGSDSDWEVSVLVTDSPAGMSANPAAVGRRSSANGDLHARLGISPHKKLIFFDVPWFMAESAAPIAAELAKIRAGEDFHFVATVEDDHVDAFRRGLRTQAVEQHFTLVDSEGDRQDSLAGARVAVFPWSIDYQPSLPRAAVTKKIPVVGVYVETFGASAGSEHDFRSVPTSALTSQLPRVLQECLSNPNTSADQKGP